MLRLLLVFLSISLLGSANAVSDAIGCAPIGQTRCKPCLRTQPDPDKKVENKSPNVTKLELDKFEAQWPSPEGSPPKYPSYSKEMSIKVQTNSEDPEGDPLIHTYTVTAGRVVGTGANVTWDLNGVWPGTYTITAAVDDGCGLCGTKITKTITVLPAENAPACLCPEIRIDHLNDKKGGLRDPTFSASVSGPQPPDITFAWTLPEGTIKSGQGTRTITIRPSDERSGQPVTITVEITTALFFPTVSARLRPQRRSDTDGTR